MGIYYNIWTNVLKENKVYKKIAILVLLISISFTQEKIKVDGISSVVGDFIILDSDIDKVLILEKRHFGALSGQGLVQSALKNYQLAIDSYIEAHKIYPAMESPIIMIERLKKLIKNETV